MSEQQFAYGLTEVKTERQSYSCPVSTAFDDDTVRGRMAEVASEYDKQVAEHRDNEVGHISATVAKKVWKDTINTLPDGSVRERLAREVAAELGWV